jgi:hypothetical protein
MEFWDRVDDSGDCWLWQGYRDRDGYGKVRYANKTTVAHRVAWMLTIGPIPDALLVLHHCDNPSCVRPDHLFLGTPRDNIHDSIAKGRFFSRQHLTGSAHPSWRGGKPAANRKQYERFLASAERRQQHNVRTLERYRRLSVSPEWLQQLNARRRERRPLEKLNALCAIWSLC